MTGRKNESVWHPPSWKCIGRLLSMVCLVLLGESRLIGADEEVRAAFRREYEPHAKELLQFYAHGEANWIHTYSYYPNEGQSVTRYKTRWSGPNFLRGSQDDAPGDASKTAPKNASTINGGNSRYEFSLDPKGEGRFALTNLTMSRPDRRTWLTFLSAPVADFSFSLRTFLEMGIDPKIEFLEFKDDLWQGKPAKKLKFRIPQGYGSILQDKGGKTLTFYFSPANGWACQALQCQEATARAVEYEDRYFYDTKAGQRLPPFTRYESWSRDKKIHPN